MKTILCILTVGMVGMGLAGCASTPSTISVPLTGKCWNFSKVEKLSAKVKYPCPAIKNIGDYYTVWCVLPEGHKKRVKKHHAHIDGNCVGVW